MVGVLTGPLGRAAAHGLVRRAVAAGGDLGAALLAEPAAADHLDAHRLDALFDPAAHVGEAPALVDRALAAHDRRSRT